MPAGIQLPLLTKPTIVLSVQQNSIGFYNIGDFYSKTFQYLRNKKVVLDESPETRF